MIFTPNRLESEKINMISSVFSTDYVLLRLTPTMIEKNNLDANGFFRDMLLKSGIVDYEELEYGGKNGISFIAQFIEKNKVENVKLKFYRVTNSRGDRRFSFETIKRKMKEKDVNEGDLLYFASYPNTNGEPRIIVINLTNNTPSKDQLIQYVGLDEIAETFELLKPKLKEILSGGYYDNSKGPGDAAPKDVGDTLEYLTGIDTNNRTDADFNGLIEFKSKGDVRTLDTLFTLRPCFDGTPIAEYEPKDRSRVSAFARYYGYESDKHPNCHSLYITIGSEDAPQNRQGFYLDVDEDNKRVSLMHIEENGLHVMAAYWTFDSLKKALIEKHPSTLWFKAQSRKNGNMVQYKYTEVEFSRSPQFMTFLSLIKRGIITYDWRGYTTISGNYAGKNHGNAWRIKPEYKDELFGSIEKISF